MPNLSVSDFPNSVTAPVATDLFYISDDLGGGNFESKKITWADILAAIPNGIYDGSGSLSGATTVTMGGNNLIFNGGNIGVDVTPTSKFDLRGSGVGTAVNFRLRDSANADPILDSLDNGTFTIYGYKTGAAGTRTAIAFQILPSGNIIIGNSDGGANKTISFGTTSTPGVRLTSLRLNDNQTFSCENGGVINFIQGNQSTFAGLRTLNNQNNFTDGGTLEFSNRERLGRGLGTRNIGFAMDAFNARVGSAAFGDSVRLMQDSGWVPATGTASKSTFDTSTVTTAQLAERVKALIDHLYGYIVTVAVDSATDVITATGHGFYNDQAVIIGSSAAFSNPVGSTEMTIYYVINRTANTFQLSATVGGAAINFTSDGSQVYVQSHSVRLLTP